jgi:glycosyltransferase involved in cell wall biosynthesis
MAGRTAVTGSRSVAEPTMPTVALLPAMDRFEDFHDTIGVSLDVFREQFSGGGLFNYVEALRSVGIRSVVFFASARLGEPVGFRHRPTGTAIRVLPSPRIHQKVQGARDRLLPDSRVMRSVLSYLSIPPRLFAKELRRERCAAILCQDYEHARFDVCVGLGRFLGLPVFATFQGGSEPASWLERPIRPLTVRGGAGLIIGAATELARVRARYHVPDGKLGHIPNPVDVRHGPVDCREARARLGIPADVRVVEWHGRVQIELKGLDVLLEAWQRICAARPGVPLLLLLVGGGNDAEELRRILQASRFDNVRWIDRFVVDRELLWQCLSAADVSVLASRREGFPIAALEAMACQRPLVATDVRGVAEMLEGGEEAGGIVVPPGDPVALAGALGRLLDDQALAHTLGIRARRRVEQRFSFEAVGPQLRQFLVGRGAFQDGG